MSVTNPVYIDNAGLVLVSPFLPALFDRLGVLTMIDGEPRVIGLEAASRAVHLLQYLVDGRLDCPEPALALNKLICGLPLAQPVQRAIEPVPSDLESCDQLLQAMIGNWPAIGNTSVSGLRETFLQRKGRLEPGDGQWVLTVERKTLDVLVDQVPWSVAVLDYRWMPQPVHVIW